MPRLGTATRIIGTFAAAALLAAVVVSAAGARPAQHLTTLNGAGSSLVAPALAIWGPAYAKAAGRDQVVALDPDGKPVLVEPA